MKIVFLNGADAGKSVELTPSGLTIGRETDNHLQLPVGGVSRYHARIEFVEGSYMLRDLGSTNGTKLNGVTLQKVEALKADDIIAIGEQQFRVQDPIPVGGKPESKIGSTTVKIPANVPVPEPAVPQFVFRPDSDTPPPPPPPPVTDSSETATVNITPEEIAEVGGSDFFAKRDGDGNLFKKDEDKGKTTQSSWRGNLIFALVIVVMLIGGAGLFFFLTPQGKNKADAEDKQHLEQGEIEENGEFFFYYEKQSVDEDNQSLVRKRVYCRRIGKDQYQIKMQYCNVGGKQDEVRIETEEAVDAEIVDDCREQSSIIRFTEDNLKTTTAVGNNLEWARLIIGDGENISDVTVTGNNDPLSFRGAEDEINNIINIVTNAGSRMQGAKETREIAENAYKEAYNYLRESEVKPHAKSLALVKFREAFEAYRSLNTPEDQNKFRECGEQFEKLRKELDEIYQSGKKKIVAAVKQKNYQEAVHVAQQTKIYFTEDSKQFNDLEEYEKRCNLELKKRQKRK